MKLLKHSKFFYRNCWRYSWGESIS